MFNPIKDERKVMLNDENESYASQLAELLKDKKYI
jgi:hypothetical protein